ncbi:MAG: DNA-3-methyladenine glycosylase I [Anaerolineales bacterium]
MTPPRCLWAKTDPAYIAYHDQEWGVPLHDDRTLFEFLTLETFQAGLSWLTILRKRENFRQAFAHFDPQRVATFGEPEITALLQNAGIIRNRAKIQAAINNAARYLEIQAAYGSFDAYIWGFVNARPIINAWQRQQDLPAFTPLAERISTDLKKRGFKFIGPTVVYAHMQATGMVNDHITSCYRYHELR